MRFFLQDGVIFRHRLGKKIFLQARIDVQSMMSQIIISIRLTKAQSRIARLISRAVTFLPSSQRNGDQRDKAEPYFLSSRTSHKVDTPCSKLAQGSQELARQKSRSPLCFTTLRRGRSSPLARITNPFFSGGRFF